MSILVDRSTRVLIQGITGAQARSDLKGSLDYGVRVVAGVTPGKGGERVHGIAIYDTVQRAVEAHSIDASAIYVPPLLAKNAVLEAISAGIKLLLLTAEYIPVHDISYIVAAARAAGVRLIGANTNGIISPGQSRLGGIGGGNPDEIYMPGRIGVCSRSGGMSAEIGLALSAAGLGISTCVSMGGDAVTGLRMPDYVALFEDDPDTDAIVLIGEPGTSNEHDVAEMVRTGQIKKPIAAVISGAFQERYPKGVSFGHAAAMIANDQDTATAKRRVLAEAGVMITAIIEEIPLLLAKKGIAA